MAETIIDGTGNQYEAQVTEENKLRGDVDSTTRETSRAEAGCRYGAGTGILELPASFSGPVVWFQNDNDDWDFHITRFVFTYNGGDTNHNRACEFTILLNQTVPTGANTVLTPGNSNFGSQRQAEATAYKWDGTGTAGMTGGTNGVEAGSGLVSQGFTAIEIAGANILPAGTSVSLTMTPEEAGTGTALIFGYYEDRE